MKLNVIVLAAQPYIYNNSVCFFCLTICLQASIKYNCIYLPVFTVIIVNIRYIYLLKFWKYFASFSRRFVWILLATTVLIISNSVVGVRWLHTSGRQHRVPRMPNNRVPCTHTQVVTNDADNLTGTPRAQLILHWRTLDMFDALSHLLFGQNVSILILSLLFKFRSFHICIFTVWSAVTKVSVWVKQTSVIRVLLPETAFQRLRSLCRATIE